MPAERVTMRKIREILRLKWACRLSNRQVAASCGMARSTVAETLYRAKAAGLSWPLPEDLDDTQLEARLYPAALPPTSPPRAVPDWATLHQELPRKGVHAGVAVPGPDLRCRVGNLQLYLCQGNLDSNVVRLNRLACSMPLCSNLWIKSEKSVRTGSKVTTKSGPMRCWRACRPPRIRLIWK